ncbi:hypothetical protein Ancab_031938 [Ancistrocladus abbreviatus]
MKSILRVRRNMEAVCFADLGDIRDKGLFYTRANRQFGIDYIACKLDWVLNNGMWMDVYANLEVEFLVPRLSNHVSAIVSFGKAWIGLMIMQVDRLKILLESLAGSITKAENRMQDHRSHKEEALSFRQAKVNEVSQVEKELITEIEELEKQKDELEAQLKKVNSSLTTANARLRNAREERQHFDDASKEILQHLQTKEDELSRSVTSCRTEADVVKSWISFIEDAWALQSTCAKQNEEQVNDELRRYAEYFSNLILRLLPVYKNELGNFMSRFKDHVGKLKSNDGLDKVAHLDDENFEEYLKTARKRKNLEEEYLDLEAKLITTFSVVESIKQLYAQNEDFSRKEDQRVDELLNVLREIKDEFDSIERPNLRVETPTKTAWRRMGGKSLKENPSRLKPTKEEHPHVQVVDGQDFLDSDEELATLESEFVKIIRDHAAEEINDWEL